MRKSPEMRAWECLWDGKFLVDSVRAVQWTKKTLVRDLPPEEMPGVTGRLRFTDGSWVDFRTGEVHNTGPGKIAIEDVHWSAR